MCHAQLQQLRADVVEPRRFVTVRRRSRKALHNAFSETLNTPRSDLRQRRWIHRFDALPRGALDDPQHAHFAREDEQNCIAAPACTAGATNAMHIGFGIQRHVVVDDMADTCNVQTTRSNIGSHHHVQPATLELRNGALTLVLIHVAMHRGRGEALRNQGIRNFCRGDLSAHEYQRCIHIFYFQQAREHFLLVHVAHLPVALPNSRDSLGRTGDMYLFRVAHMPARNCANRIRQRRREQRHLTFSWHALEQPFNVVDEAHAQHFIGFVEHQQFEVRQLQCAARHVVHDPTWRTHNNVHATAQCLQLRAHTLAAVHRQHLNARHVPRIATQRLGHLHGQLTGRRQDQCLRLRQTQIEAL